MKLKNLTDTVLELEERYLSTCDIRSEKWDIILKHANFLKQPLTLGMFVPCDLEGNALVHPGMNVVFKNKAEFDMHNALLKKFKKAQERVLFKGFESYTFEVHKILEDYETIEELTNLWGKDVELTPNAIKQLK